MKLQIMSDLHLEFSNLLVSDTDADVIVLAGDIWLGTKAIKWADSVWPGKPVIYVPGNHEFYGYNRTELLVEMRELALETGHIHLLDENEIVIDGVRFLGCTLWTDFMLFGEGKKKWCMYEASEYLADFRRIMDDDVQQPGWKPGRPIRFTPAMSVDLHKRALAWLEKRLVEPFDGKTVVVTHHLPSRLSVAGRFLDEYTSAGFASELDHLFSKMDLWVHGHTHDNFDYMSNGTRVVCNPRGYVTYQGAENFDFNPNLIVDI